MTNTISSSKKIIFILMFPHLLSVPVISTYFVVDITWYIVDNKQVL